MKNISKAILGVSATAIAAGATLIPSAVLAWGDSANGRPSYTIDQINAGALGNTITFNSISNGKIGNEKNFVGALPAGSSSSTWNADTINVEDGKTYTIRLYVHNNSPKGTNAVAQNVTAQFSLPTTVAKEQTVIGYLNSSNATPNRYWDEVKLVANENIYLKYVEGSARYTNALGTFTLPNEVITSGATLGYQTMNGQIPGCYEYDGVVTINVEAHKSVSTELKKYARIKGSNASFNDGDLYINAKEGDEVEFRIKYVNKLGSQVNNVMIRDVLPTNMEYVPNTTYLYNSNYPSGVLLANNDITTRGINIGNYTANANASVIFTAKVVNKTLACGTNQLVNWASATVSGEVFKDDVSVMIEHNPDSCKGGTEPTPTPKPEPVVPEPTVTPNRVVDTGPEGVVASALGTGSIVTAAGYFIASRKRM